MKPPKQRRTLALFVSILLLVSCAHQPIEAYDPPGFFTGLWNGFTILFSLIGHPFDNGIRIASVLCRASSLVKQSCPESPTRFGSPFQYCSVL